MSKVKGTQQPKMTFEGLEAKAKDQLAELEIETPDSEDVLVFEGGPLDGKQIPASQGRKLDEIETETPAAADKATDDDAGAAEGEEGATEPAKTPDAAEAKPEGQEPDASTEAEETSAEEEEPTPAYKGDLTYKVYGEEKKFPEWAAKVVTSKETEDQLRGVLQKSEAFDALKPKHETTIRERDEARRFVDQSSADAQEMTRLRDTNLPLFLKKMGVSDKAVLDFGVQLAVAEKDPEAARALADRREADARAFDQSIETRRATQTQAEQFAEIHRTNVQTVMAQPDSQQFRARVDATYGPGSFDRVFTETGEALCNQAGGYVPPAAVLEAMKTRFGTALVAPQSPQAQQPAPAPATQTAAPAAQPANGSPAAKAPHQRPKTLPNVGRGTSVTPTKTRMRSLEDVEKRVQSELRR